MMLAEEVLFAVILNLDRAFKLAPEGKPITWITKDVYDQKALELRTDQANIQHQLNKIDKADEKFAITLEYLVSLAARAADLFKSSKTEEKRQLIKYVFSNFEIEGKKYSFFNKKTL